ncbi:LytTR family DNA-binding domain-containing protein [uncultured Bacteroides sp.]|uniref:LytR/AlgR family response regulator transcription factor n=1 Tax=uncultured Bacteroides sp. TaxID=162156 RepID=UPI002AA63000|nr:LytTR family DNA-binding domain-containing protein [uncultured Bacteroides sp.]
MNMVYSYYTIKKEIAYVTLWIVLTFCSWGVMTPLAVVSASTLLLDCSCFSALIFLTGWCWTMIAERGGIGIIIAPRTILNYVTLGIFILAVWAGLHLLCIYLLLSRENFALVIALFPLHLFIGGLIIMSYVIYDFLLSRKEDEAELPLVDEVEEIQPVEEEILERVAVKSGQKIQVIFVADICYLQADGDYVILFTENAKYLKEQTMKYFMAHLPKNQFVRIHRSCIVNIEKVLRIELYKKQQQMITLKNGHQIKASTAGYKALKDILKL